MARKLRLEFPGAIYHVINRGNRRVGTFDDERTRDAFEMCLFEACERSKWVLHAYVVMSNHFHLALETPRGNLVTGMQWLQATFTNRYNRFRHEAGHGSIFQGRYKALMVEPGAALGLLCHYLHLNPVRARIVPFSRLGEWRWSSYRWMKAKAQRPKWLQMDAALREAGELGDQPEGWAAYDRFLAWQAEEGPAGKGEAFVSMSQGWALGTERFRAALIKDFDLAATARAWETSGAREMKAVHCDDQLRTCLRALGKARWKASGETKGAPWKIAVAAWMKQNTEASNAWLAERLKMGSATRVSQVVSVITREPRSEAAEIHRRLGETLACFSLTRDRF